MIRIPHLETDVTVACQLSCVACNHLVVPWRASGNVWYADPDQIRADLTRLSTFVHADRWGALGGEPLLHPRIADILRIAKESGIADKIELWSNGIAAIKFGPDHPLWTTFDVFVLSLYASESKFYSHMLPPAGSDDPLDAPGVRHIRRMCNLNGIELEIKNERVWHNFRTNLEKVPTGPAETKTKFDGCFFRQFSRVANNGFFYTCCCAPHQPRLFQGREEGADGVSISGLTEQGLLSYLNRTEPLGCCTICAGRDTAKEIDWSEERDIEKWTRKSKGLEAPPKP